MTELVKAHGPIAFAILIGGLLAVMAGVMSLALSRSRFGAAFGAVGLVLCLLTTSASVVGAMGARIEAERSIESADSEQREATMQAGAQKSRALAKLGTGFGLVAFGLSAFGMWKVLWRRARAAAGPKSTRGEEAPSSRAFDPMSPFESTRGIAAVVLTGLALFTVLGAAMPFLVPSPGGGSLVKGAEKFSDAEKLLADGNFEQGCAMIEAAFAEGLDPKRARVKNMEGMVSECFENKLGKALNGAPPDERARILADLATSKMPMNEEQQRRLAEARAETPTR